MNFTTEPVELLVSMAWEDNPRSITSHNQERLRTSLRTFGQVAPVVANRRTNKLVSGHQRVRAAQLNDVEELEVSWVDLDDEDAAALAVLLNDEHAQGTWDRSKLADTLERLSTYSPDHVTLAGFDVRAVVERVKSTPLHMPEAPAGMAGAPAPPRTTLTFELNARDRRTVNEALTVAKRITGERLAAPALLHILKTTRS